VKVSEKVKKVFFDWFYKNKPSISTDIRVAIIGFYKDLFLFQFGIIYCFIRFAKSLTKDKRISIINVK